MRTAGVLLLVHLLMAGAASAAAAIPIPVHIGGRVAPQPDGSLAFGWPGVYFEGRFRGTGVSVAVESGTEHLRLLVDGRERAVLVKPGSARLTLAGLPPGEHVVRLEKMTESQSGGGRFLGFFAEPEAIALPPAPRPRQIEFIGDSYSVGYGNTSPRRECTADEVHNTTDTSRAFGPLLASRLGADYRVNAYSGFGMVRNYAGGVPALSLPTVYPRLIPGQSAPVDSGSDGGWRPHLIVINLGTNDFSTPLRPGERWPDQASLRSDYRARYVAFARHLMSRQPQARLILMGSDEFFGEVAQVAATLVADRPGRVVALRFGGLARTGCDWHPDLADHHALADLVERRIAAMAMDWD